MTQSSPTPLLFFKESVFSRIAEAYVCSDHFLFCPSIAEFDGKGCSMLLFGGSKVVRLVLTRAHRMTHTRIYYYIFFEISDQSP